MENVTGKYLALSGGVGGAKLALGLSHVLTAEQLLVVANTGDDFEHMGLTICPDIDTLIYTLSDHNNKELGWGRDDESWQFMQACEELGLETWFQLGDKDLALHVYRARCLADGMSLSEVTRELCRRFNIATPIVPMSDDSVRTRVETSTGTLAFQEYFVKHRCAPVVKTIEYSGTDEADLSPDFLRLLQDPELQAVIICPSNPFLSIQPILSLPGLVSKLKELDKPIIVVSPIVEGQALKGPTAKMMQELNMECDVYGIAECYKDIANAMVIDHKDSGYVEKIEALGIKVCVSNIIMQSLQDRIDLAREVVQFSKQVYAGYR